MQTPHTATGHRGPPHDCRHCGGGLKKTTETTSEGTGCIVIILGLILTPALIGIPIVLYGIHLSSKRRGFWQCRTCGTKFDRMIKWFELG